MQSFTCQTETRGTIKHTLYISDRAIQDKCRINEMKMYVFTVNKYSKLILPELKYV